MNTVYIVQNPMRRDPVTGDMRAMHDLTPAREYGDLQVLLPSGPVLLSTANAVTTLRQKLMRFTDADHLLCLGDPVAIAAASAMVADVNNGVVPLLVWDRKTAKYLSIKVDIHRRLANANA